MYMTNLEVGTKEWFAKVFWPINPVGDQNGAGIDTAYYYANKSIGDILPDNELLTWEILLKRYTDFYNYMFPLQNGKYTKKENKLLNIEDYCFNKMYNSDYSKIQENPADAYLFGI